MSIIYGNLVGGVSALNKTFLLVDENGNEVPAVVVESLTVFDATPEDLKRGKVAASNDGVIIGVHDCE